MALLTREFFMNFYHQINHDALYNAFLIKTELPKLSIFTHRFDSKINDKIMQKMKQDGYCIVHFEHEPTDNEILHWVTTMIGEPSQDSSQSGQLFSKIIAEPEAKYFANTHYTQPLHTDDAHVADTPSMIALYCKQQAKQGGISTLVKLDQFYSLLTSQQALFKKLCSKDALKINGVQGSLSRSLLYPLAKKTLGIVFPVFVNTIEADDSVLRVYKELLSLFHQVKNQIRFKLSPGDLLLVDNFRVLHGRTQFDLHSERVLYRFCFQK